MAKQHPTNTRIKHRYFDYLKQAHGRDEASIDVAARALVQFEQATGHKDFKTFHQRQAVAFKDKLAKQISKRTGQPLSRATLHSTLAALRAFFLWLAGQPGYKSRLRYGDADYFNLSDKEVRIAKADRFKTFPSLNQIHHVIGSMPTGSAIELRNRALIAFTLLTGARDGAIASLKLKHVDLADSSVFQDAREVRTKASKTFKTWFFPVGGEALSIVQDWCHYLRTELLWGDGDPLFPPTQIGIGENGGFAATGLRRECWQGAGPIRKVFETAFVAAGLPYFSPHSFRKTLVQLGGQICVTAQQFKAWSQNLGHDQVMTTLTSYGQVEPQTQAQLIWELGNRLEAPGETELAEALVTLQRLVRKNGEFSIT